MQTSESRPVDTLKFKSPDMNTFHQNVKSRTTRRFDETLTEAGRMSSTAQADLRIESVKISQDFIDAMAKLDAPLPWGSTDTGEVYDADMHIVCDVSDYLPNGAAVAAMIVVAVNTCGSFRATRRDQPTSTE